MDIDTCAADGRSDRRSEGLCGRQRDSEAESAVLLFYKFVFNF